MSGAHPGHGAPDVGGWAGLARSAAAALESPGGGIEESLVRELLVFGLDDSTYAIPVERVREIVRMRAPTRVPRAPDRLLGVIALRGEVVEVIDLRRSLGFAGASPGPKSRIIVLHGDVDRVTGLLVDSVEAVLRISEESFWPAVSGDSGSVVEMCRSEDRFVSVLDVDRLLGVADD